MFKFSQLVSLSLLVCYFSERLFTRVAKATLIRSRSLIRSINPNWTIMLATFQRFHPVQSVELQHILLLDKQYLIHCLIFQKVKSIINMDITSMQGESIFIILIQILIRFLSLFRSKPCITKAYLIFVIFFTRAKFLENEIYTEKMRKLRQNTQ